MMMTVQTRAVNGLSSGKAVFLGTVNLYTVAGYSVRSSQPRSVFPGTQLARQAL